MLKDFIQLLEKEVVNKSLYCWGAQGEPVASKTDAWIRNREVSVADANRVITLRNKRLQAGYKNMKMFDCSGLGIYALLLLNLRKSDTNANGLMKLCAKLGKDDLHKGDWVFRVYTVGAKKGRAYHIGYVVDDELNVIEAQGRDVGVVKRSLNASGATYWNYFGRPSYFQKEIEEAIKIEDEIYTFTKVLVKINTTPIPYDEQVKNLQQLLKNCGFSTGSIDGKFGKYTEDAVRLFQSAMKLKVDGKVGEQTVKALGGKWKPKT